VEYDFFVRAMVLAIVHLVCKAVPGRHVRWIIAVPQQHATFELFEQTGAAVHLALCKPSMPLCSIVRLSKAVAEFALVSELVEKLCSIVIFFAVA
jgi:hypothetical protein